MSDHETHHEQDYLNRGVKPAEDQWTRAVPLTPDELAAWRIMMNAINNDLGRAPERYTCDDCARAPKCNLAFDGYCTDGDCLYSK